MKVVLLLLAASTLVAASIVLPRADLSNLSLLPLVSTDSAVPFAFVLALAGWMPSDIAVSGHSSLWTLAKAKQSGWAPVRTVQTRLSDFIPRNQYFGFRVPDTGCGSHVWFGRDVQLGRHRVLDPAD